MSMDISHSGSHGKCRGLHIIGIKNELLAVWLDIIREGEDWTFVDTDRLGELVKGMPFPER
ncbi:uncharacterized protein N7529_009247 [Penicillium soppii]|uniref:uncharacterized protein n=1 Tax=Penicillium soppii TaxID=69789 RepID=UPI0025497EF9|nr:uncharacterized protein N7529_009247 [Penicillium soppii]KAJ5861937.1 hypothetical protein N7529_009247 [Penicillium soppii]